jgi:hypothetical protein
MIRSFVLLLALASPALAQQKTPIMPDRPTASKTGPILPDAPAPTPPPPSTPTQLGAGVWYVVRFSEPLTVLGSPDGVLAVSAKAGPITTLGQYSDSPGAISERTFTDPHIYFVTAQTTGTAELLVIWSGGVIRRTIAATAGPPGPGPALAAALIADKAPPGTAAALAGVYQTVATTTVNDKTISTCLQLSQAGLAIEATALAPLGITRANLTNTSAVVDPYLATQLGSNPSAAFDPVAAKAAFAALAQALQSQGKVKP